MCRTYAFRNAACVFFLVILGVIITVVSFLYVYETFVNLQKYAEQLNQRKIFGSYTDTKKNLESSKKHCSF